MFVEELRNNDEWENFVLSSSKGTFFQTLRWKRILEKSFSLEPVYLVVRDSNENIVGICPFFVHKFWPFKILDSLPFSDFGGPLIKEELNREVSDLIKDCLGQLASKRGITYARIRFSNSELCEFFKSGSSEVATTTGVMSLDLKEKPANYIWNKVFTARGGQRKYIKRFERDGFQSREAQNVRDLDQFYVLYFDNMNYIGASPYRPDFFKNIWISLYPENFNVLLIEKKEECVGAVASFIYNGALYNTYLGLDRKAHKKYHISYYLFWETIKFAQKKGLECVHFGSTSSDPNAVHYSQKKNMGATFNQHYFLYIPFDQGLLHLRRKALMSWKRLRNRLPKSLVKKLEGELKSIS